VGNIGSTRASGPPEGTIVTDEKQDGTIDEAGETQEPPQYGVGPFSIREVALVGTWLVAFVVSFFPIYGDIGEGPSVWSSGIDWVLTVGVPTVAVFLIVLRRLSPQGIRRVGSLGIDQFASVAFSVATVLWLTILWNSFIRLANRTDFLATWVVWVEFFLMLAGVILVAAVLSKFAGCGLGAIALGKADAIRIGVGMIPRGEVGMVVAQIGLGLGIIQQNVYSVVVFMSVATTIVAPPLLNLTFRGLKPESTGEAPDFR
jgi:hypothetical protein